MRISDWSSDVCSSDLEHQLAAVDHLARGFRDVAVALALRPTLQVGGTALDVDGHSATSGQPASMSTARIAAMVSASAMASPSAASFAQASETCASTAACMAVAMGMSASMHRPLRVRIACVVPLARASMYSFSDLISPCACGVVVSDTETPPRVNVEIGRAHV